jgi:hypothetical protein
MACALPCCVDVDANKVNAAFQQSLLLISKPRQLIAELCPHGCRVAASEQGVCNPAKLAIELVLSGLFVCAAIKQQQQQARSSMCQEWVVTL